MRAAVVTTVALAAFAGCGDDPGEARRSDATTEHDADAETASVVCEGLRSHVNALVDTVNDAVAGVGARTPEARAEALVGGFASTHAVAAALVDDVASWPIPEVPERAALVEELQAGAEAGVAELADEATAFGTPDEIADDDVHGQVGVLFNAVEKAMSVLEPRIHAYERTEFQQAFLDEPACRHVIQPFELG